MLKAVDMGSSGSKTSSLFLQTMTIILLVPNLGQAYELLLPHRHKWKTQHLSQTLSCVKNHLQSLLKQGLCLNQGILTQ